MIGDCLLLNCIAYITAEKCETEMLSVFNRNKKDLHHQKVNKKLHIRLNLLNCVLVMSSQMKLKRVFKPAPGTLCEI